MHLDSIRELKRQLLTASKQLALSQVSAPSRETFSTTHEVAAGALQGIALGAVADKKGFRLAVRQQQASPFISAVTEEIASLAKGEVDIKYVGPIVKQASLAPAAWYRRVRRPLTIGCSISDLQPGVQMAGTLGCFVVARAAPHYWGVLTNNHVIAGENRNLVGAPLLQPGTLDRGQSPKHIIGELGKYVRLKKTKINFVDAAFGILYDGCTADIATVGNLGKLHEERDVAEMTSGDTVYKVGRTTGQTKGRITAFDLDNVLVQYDVGVLRFDQQIEIEGTGHKAFCDGGDSGSVVVDKGLHPIGLLFAGSSIGSTNGKGLTFVNPIATVLDALEVDIDR
ncbi:hypothetical protein NA78x_002109 [Anatilimnocola sp. NA78]|uniref:hypothetical protein n=1 Tax=Anatilimnocola sp. NA78 TaxID=3415683 RepID=UPI003CE59593